MTQIQWQVKLAGVTFGDRQQNIKAHVKNDSEYRLVREPENPHDKNAIMVTANGYDIGYVPRGKAAEMAPLIDQGIQLKTQLYGKVVDEKGVKPTWVIIEIWA